MRTAFDDEMAQIAALDDSIEPEVLMTPTTIKRKAPVPTCSSPHPSTAAKRRLVVHENTSEEHQPSTSSASTSSEQTTDNPDHPSSPLPPESRRNVQAKFLEAYLMECENRQTRAEEKQKRHAEKMEKLEKLTDIFAIIANNLATR